MSAWDDFIKRVDREKKELGFRVGEECFYRGVSDSSYDLEPSLFRIKSHGGREQDLLVLEYDLFFEFKARAKELHHETLIDWEWLFEMRHHGLPTRLLDWTEVLGVAIYFAAYGYQEGTGRTPRIWLMNPYALNELGSKDRDLIAPTYLGCNCKSLKRASYEYIVVQRAPKFGWQIPLAIYPSQKANRMHSQRGWFTIHGDDQRPLNRILASRPPGVIAHVDLSPEVIKEAMDFLEAAGINAYSLFPDLDGLSRELHRKYQINYD